MGCPHSTNHKHKVLPSSPTSKSSRARTSPRTEFTSPRTDEFNNLFPDKAMTFDTSPGLRISPAEEESPKNKPNKEKIFSPPSNSPIKGITIQPVESIIPSHESLAGQAVIGEKGMTFFSMENFGNYHTADFGNEKLPTVHDKSSSKQDSSSGNITTDKPAEKNLIKLITFGGTPCISTEDLDNNNKKPPSRGQEEQQKQRSSLVFSKVENFPETPGFKPVATTPPTENEQLDFATTFKKEKPLIPTFKIQRADHQDTKLERIESVKTVETVTERKPIKPLPKFEIKEDTADIKNKKPPATPQEVLNLERGQRFSFQDSMNQNVIPVLKKGNTASPKEKQSSPKSPEKSPEAKRNSELHLMEAKRRFTQNLLDLVVPNKNSPTLKKNGQAPPIILVSSQSKKTLVDLLNDSHYQTTTQVSSRPNIENPKGSARKTFFRDEQMPDQEQYQQQEVKSATSIKGLMSPLKFANSTEFVHNGDSISPINTKQGGGATPPFSNRTFLKNFIGSGGELPTHTNVEVITRNDVGENSFSVDAKQNEGENCNTSLESINLRQSAWKKSSFAGMLPARNPSPQQNIPTLQDKQMSLSSPKTNSYQTKSDSLLDMSEVDALPPLKEIKSTPFLRMPTLKMKRPRSLVIETSKLDKSIDENGFKKINQYTITSDLGKGGFAKVKLGIIWEEGKYLEYAIKIANKKKINKRMFVKQNNAFSQLQTEIAVLKKMDHPNVVQLFEVIDDSHKDKLYLVMEFASKGAIMSKKFWKEFKKENGIPEDEPDSKLSLTPVQTRKYFKDLIRGLDYMHNYANIVHRDIKPENLLIDKTNTLKITDFNVSHMFENQDDILKTNAGTQAFLAPEAWSGSSFRGKPADIWAAGVTLYYFVYGKFPFKQKIGQDIQTVILTKEPEFPEDKEVDPRIIQLIKDCLVKDPAQRITMDKIITNSWLTEEGQYPINNKIYKPVNVTEEDIRQAITSKLRTSFMVAHQLVRSLNSARQNLAKSEDKL